MMKVIYVLAGSAAIAALILLAVLACVNGMPPASPDTLTPSPATCEHRWYC
jgi:hypothetical protein